jgi:hypothetical protein
VSKQKNISDESQGREVPSTQDVVISDRRDLSEATPLPVPDKVQVEEKKVVEERGTLEKTHADKDIAQTHSKTLVPMADAVVPTATTEDSVEKAEEESGFWGSIASFFGSDDEEVHERSDSDTAGKESEAGAAAPPVTVSSATHTGKDDLAPDAGVLAMIEQIEGPAPEPEEVEVVEQETVSVADVESEPEATVPTDGELKPESPSVETEHGAVVENKAVAGNKEAPGPAAGSTVGAMIAQIEADQVEESTSSPVDTVYTVETPEQAQAKRRLLIDRLLDVGRCVACDLAGADLAGEKLDEADLERTNLAGANLEGVDLSESNLKGVDFSGANLKRADLRDADLYLADFSGADLTGAKLKGALIDMADFSNARGAVLEGTVNE